jgi:MOSC domain-containing protein YiiM
MPNNHFTLSAICTGSPHIIRSDGATSAIFKFPTDLPVKIGFLGLEEDVQADLRVHGGPDKAIHLYPHSHYPAWRQFLGNHAALDIPGAFGENLCVQTLTEADMLLGDIFQLGSATLEVSMGRQPCWKVDARFGTRTVMAHMVRTGHVGAYCRVLVSGVAAAGDTLNRVKRGDAAWPLNRLFHGLISGKENLEKSELETLAHHPILGKTWRDRAAKLRLALS